MPITAAAAPGAATKIALTAVLIASGATIAHLAPAPAPPYLMVEELMRDPQRHAGDAVRVHGFVMPGTIVAVGPETHDFVLQWHGARLRVRHHGVRPDPFRDQAELVERGTLRATDAGWLLDGDQMLAKCGGKYDGDPAAKVARFE